MDRYKRELNVIALRAAEVNIYEEIRGIGIRRTNGQLRVVDVDDDRHGTPRVSTIKTFPLSARGLRDAVAAANAQAEVERRSWHVRSRITDDPFTVAECLASDPDLAEMVRPKRDDAKTLDPCTLSELLFS